MNTPPVPPPLRSPMPRHPYLDREEPELTHEDDIPSPEPAPPAEPPRAPEHDPARAEGPAAAPHAAPAQEEGVLTGLAKELGLMKPDA